MKLPALLRELADHDRGRRASDRCEQGLVAEFRARRRTRQSFWAALAVAAALALLLLAPSRPAPVMPAVVLEHAPPFAPGEMRQVVRVSIPRDQLAEWGLVPPQGPSATVQLDLLVGADTLVRAVRIVD